MVAARRTKHVAVRRSALRQGVAVESLVPPRDLRTYPLVVPLGAGRGVDPLHEVRGVHGDVPAEIVVFAGPLQPLPQVREVLLHGEVVHIWDQELLHGPGDLPRPGHHHHRVRVEHPLEARRYIVPRKGEEVLTSHHLFRRAPFAGLSEGTAGRIFLVLGHNDEGEVKVLRGRVEKGPHDFRPVAGRCAPPQDGVPLGLPRVVLPDGVDLGVMTADVEECNYRIALGIGGPQLGPSVPRLDHRGVFRHHCAMILEVAELEDDAAVGYRPTAGVIFVVAGVPPTAAAAAVEVMQDVLLVGGRHFAPKHLPHPHAPERGGVADERRIPAKAAAKVAGNR
mmetsp:Transcript_31424/g.94012  ORF Transcript_31424/g.94012 Transcript_31424/m.94012 type:complete len:337 (+) Transcript_31424:243-1253(+)